MIILCTIIIEYLLKSRGYTMKNKINLIKWEFRSLKIGMIEVGGKFYCSTNALTKALGVTDSHISRIFYRHKKEFDRVRCHKDVLQNISKHVYENEKSFIRENKDSLMITRLKSDMAWWSEKEMLIFAYHFRSDRAMEFREEISDLVIKNAVKNYVTADAYNQLVKDNEAIKLENKKLESRISDIEKLILMFIPAANEIASGAGRMLSLQKGTKQLRSADFIM